MKEGIVKVDFRERDYNIALKKNSSYKLALKDCLGEAKSLGVSITEKDLLASTSAFNIVAEKLVKSLDVNLPNILPVKYLEMSDINTSGLSIASNRFQAVRNFKEAPKKDDYYTILTGEKAAQYKELEAYAEVLNHMHSKGIIKSLMKVQQATANQIKIEYGGTYLVPNIN